MKRQVRADVPGLIDAHVHIKGAAALPQLAAAGIVAARDAGLRENAGQARERLIFTGGTRPLVVSAGWALYKKGGYGSLFGVAVEGRKELAEEIRRLARAGAGIIKVMASGLVSLRRPGVITAGGFSGDELKELVEEAQGAGLGVMAHANGEPAVLAAAQAGVRSVEHGFFMTRRALEAMARQGVFWTPTVGALARAAEAGVASGEMKAYIAGLIVTHVDMIRHAHGIGVPLAIGTDCVLPAAGYRAAYEAELLYFEQAGLSREAVMMIACEGGARLLGKK